MFYEYPFILLIHFGANVPLRESAKVCVKTHVCATRLSIRSTKCKNGYKSSKLYRHDSMKLARLSYSILLFPTVL